jgi:hypothetical protein
LGGLQVQALQEALRDMDGRPPQEDDPLTRKLVRELAHVMADQGDIQLAHALYRLSCSCLTL